MENGMTYINKFSIVSDAKKNEFILTFYQEIPQLDDKYEVSTVDSKAVGSFVMNRAMFTSLCNNLGLVLQVNGEDTKTKENV